MRLLSAVITGFASTPGDTQAVRSEKVAIFMVAVACSLAGLLWAATYWVIFGWGLTTFLPIAFSIVVGSSLAISHFAKNHLIVIYTQIFSITVIPTLIQWSIGGLFDSGIVLVWTVLGPLGALMFFSPRRSAPWFLLYFINLSVTVAFDGFFTERALEVSESVQRFFFAMNLGVSSLVVFGFAGYFVRAAIVERSNANRLLLNVLPPQIAETLKRSDDTIARHYDSVSVLFADVVGSTPLFADLEPTEVVDWLNEVFSVLDDVVDQHGLEKLRTMGDGYMVGSGVPVPRDDHARALVACSLDMLKALEDLPARNGQRMTFRFGINSGPVVAGVIGKSKFHYDLWGDTVNVASRMESYGEAGRIHISQNTYELVKDEFDCTSRGMISIKGKGEMQTWFVVSSATSSERPTSDE